MSQIALSGVAIEFGGQPLLENVSFTVGKGDRWGIVGRNGSGKTTLFNIVAGVLEPTRGNVSRAPGTRILLLDQHREFDPDTSVWDAAAAPFADLIALEKSLAAQAAALADDPTGKALEQYGRDLERFEREGGYAYAARVDAVLDGLGFDPMDARSRPVSVLSGGERGRLALARQLAAPSDVLLLDEPTNHLDLRTTAWLEEYLLRLDATILVISHDRAFLERIADHILHVEAGTATPYTGNYSSFVTQRATRRLAQQRAYEQQQRKIAAEEEYIRRNIAGQNSRQARGRRTRLERMPRLAPPPGEEGVMALELKADERGGDQVLVAEDVRLVIGDRVLLDDFSARVERGDVIGLVGPNGAGKSTLLRAILGERTTDGGTIRIGESIRVDYYRQDLGQVPMDRTLFDVIHDLRPQWDRGKVQGHLGRFGFHADEVQRRAETLSGGERARVALAIMMLSGANFLVFDEPTNHLDVETIEALEDAIEAFDGTVLLVSHDRALLRALVTRVWALRDGRIHDFPGTFAEWEVVEAERQAALEQAAAEEAAQRREREKKNARRHDEERRERLARNRQARRAVERAEERVAALEERIAELRSTLEDPGLYGTTEGAMRAHRLKAELDEAERQLEAALAEWTEAAEALETLAAADD